MNKILVACDGSAASMHAVAHAARIANESRAAAIVLLHVLDPMRLPAPTAALPPHALSKLYPEPARQILEPALELLRNAGVEPIVRCRAGAPAAQIADEVAESGCDAIVMGTRGMRPLASLALGSVSNGVVSLVSVPVTLVK